MTWISSKVPSAHLNGHYQQACGGFSLDQTDGQLVGRRLTLEAAQPIRQFREICLEDQMQIAHWARSETKRENKATMSSLSEGATRPYWSTKKRAGSA